MSNFDFLPQEYQSLKGTLVEAEQHALVTPVYAAILCRKALEEWVNWIYQHEPDLEIPYNTSLYNLMENAAFEEILIPGIYQHLDVIRRMGNNAAHGKQKVKPKDSVHALKLIHLFTKSVCQMYDGFDLQVPDFDINYIPDGKQQQLTKERLAVLEEELKAQKTKLEKAHTEITQYKTQREENIGHIPVISDPNEALTRELYIDSLLIEAGWDLDAPNVREYRLQDCMSKENGDLTYGIADYVLWGKDGLPLAVIEAKRTSKDARTGSQQAKLYADCLEDNFKQRPVVFFTNGYHIWIWDEVAGYPQREILGYYTQDELQTLINRRATRQDLKEVKVNEEITGRPYQMAAIQAALEFIDNKRRGVLLVLATGTGKTRIAVSMSEIMTQTNWAKRILFLADRTALVRQAKNSFNTLVPHLAAINLVEDKVTDSARIVFSTYQTLINLIDSEVVEDQKVFGVGYFDLVIFDEIHRSVYNKYKHIFNYFDAIRLGLTATPKAFGDKDTYALFNLESNNPTYAYELDEAVEAGYLVPPVAFKVKTKFLEEGIVYSELSEEDKRKYEEEFADPETGEVPEEIESEALNKWLYNRDTVLKILMELMQKGLRVEGGEKIGKTIIFTKSRKHSLFIKQIFEEEFPELGGSYMALIDYQEKYKDQVLEDFKNPLKMPQIAVSVDMLDTGIDVPEILNLVFIKPVRSYAKFWQMIGRGTRLCPDVYGYQGDEVDERGFKAGDKKEFYIFDACNNFEYFSINPRGVENSASPSLSQRLFDIRVDLALQLQNHEEEEVRVFAEEVKDYIHKQVQEINKHSFMTRPTLKTVEKYCTREQWNSLTKGDLIELTKDVSHLVKEKDTDELAKRFDLMMYEMQLSMLVGSTKQVRVIESVKETAQALHKKTSIPQVAKKKEVIVSLLGKSYWESINLLGVDKLRTDIRDLIKFLDKTETKLVYTDITDSNVVSEIIERPTTQTLDVYRERVKQFFKEHERHLTIDKIKKRLVISPMELEELERMLLSQGEVNVEQLSALRGNFTFVQFIKNMVGMDRITVEKGFANFLQDNYLNVKQIAFISEIVNYITAVGYVTEEIVVGESTFTKKVGRGILDLFPDTTEIMKIVKDYEPEREIS
ncbi:DEAD/DEAH box helicase family protein [Myroides marinus]|uniref:DEAD/DEAH box helicase family protein n=1 Tax=Myroides marinus TaxID=703342 RepID=UPI002575F053|nr:DEAD/DEAH box helicase family protein [Myroides marinus]MDM1349912.1 DEAD/DEAH box helicase family protein [Myroides marinus]MDM1357120.1 DEAD/DEAH box helicase family protein [Myroides marinus]